MERMERIRYGGDYNPEQWPEHVWLEDVALMREAGVNTVTVGVFSWARIEPRPGTRDFGWLDRVLDLLHAHGVGAILATPTASPPPWLGHRHPATLPVTADGVRLGHGSRNQYCPNSAVYREHADAVVEDLAARYSGHPAVEMWHVNNELGPWCWCEDNCAPAFRTWLRDRYGKGEEGLDALNQAWGTAFWSQHYGDWDEITPPRRAPYLMNPAQELDYGRFQSDALVGCFDAEAAILRRHDPGIPVTTNLIPDYFAVDQWRLRGRMDVASVDSYPDPALGADAGASHAYASDLARSLSRGQPWVLMEQAPSEVNWRPVNRHKKPGQMRLYSLQAIARGADASLFFQWRQSTAGAERFHSGMLPNTGTGSRVFREIKAHGEELGTLARVAGTTVRARAAIILDWPSRWALGWRGKVSERVDYQRIVQAWHAALWRENVTTDFASVTDDLRGYPLVLAPALHVLSERDVEHLAAYVAGGGHLVAGHLSGTVDENTRLHPGGWQAGGLRSLLGRVGGGAAPAGRGRDGPMRLGAVRRVRRRGLDRAGARRGRRGGGAPGRRRRGRHPARPRRRRGLVPVGPARGRRAGGDPGRGGAERGCRPGRGGAAAGGRGGAARRRHIPAQSHRRAGPDRARRYCGSPGALRRPDGDRVNAGVVLPSARAAPRAPTIFPAVPAPTTAINRSPGKTTR